MVKRTLTVLASLFIIVGIIMTLENFGVLAGITKLWPVMSFLLGIGFLILFFQSKKKDPALIFISSFLTLVSIFFYYLNRTSWLDLSYLWTIFLGIVGLSFLATSIFTKKRIFLYLSIAFIIIFLALFLVFTISLQLWPLSFVIFGISLLVIEYIPSETFKKKSREKNKK